MRLHAVFVLLVVLGVATSNGFFIKKAADTLVGVKLNLVNDAKIAITDLKESARLKAKAITGGIKAIGSAKVGLVKSVKHAKIGLLKGIAGAKLAKVAAIKAGKIAFVKAKVAPIVHAGHVKAAVFHGVKDHLVSSTSSAKHSIGSLFHKSSSSASSSAAIGGGANIALFPAPSSFPTQINIVTYKSEAQSSSQSSSSGNHVYAYSSAEPPREVFPVPAPVTSYGKPIPVNLPSTSYGAPIHVSPPSTSYGVPIRR